MAQRLPVKVLSGFLGAGEITLEGAVTAALDTCLLGFRDASAFDPVRHRGAPDPFPSSESAHAA